MGDALGIALLVMLVAAVVLAGLLYRRLRPLLAESALSVAAAADTEHTVRAWLRPLLVTLAGGILLQIFTMAGCNTTPTQTRLDRDEEAIRELQGSVVPRKELEDHWSAIAGVGAQRDKRVERLETQLDTLTTELLRRFAR